MCQCVILMTPISDDKNDMKLLLICFITEVRESPVCKYCL